MQDTTIHDGISIEKSWVLSFSKEIKRLSLDKEYILYYGNLDNCYYCGYYTKKMEKTRFAPQGEVQDYLLLQVELFAPFSSQELAICYSNVELAQKVVDFLYENGKIETNNLAEIPKIFEGDNVDHLIEEHVPELE